MKMTDCLSRLPGVLPDLHPCPPAADRAAWQGLPAAVRQELLARGEAALGRPFAPITAQDWLLFSQTGDRARFEALYFGRRRQLNDLILAECVEYGGRFLPDILDGVWALCEESAWQLPAHNTYVRDAPQLPLPDVQRPVLDLFACETGALLAMARYLLADALDGLSPFVCRRLEAELERRILAPYLQAHFWWMGHGEEPMNNWTSWCTQNVLLTVFCTPQPQDVRRAVVDKAAASLDCFLKDYGPDGCCCEGAQYYSHAGLTLWGALEILCAAAPAAFSPLWDEEKVRNIAAYIYHMHVAGPYYINFADCSPLAGRRGAREFLFARRTGNAAMAAFCAADWRAARHEPAPEGDIARINLWYLTLEAFHAAELDAFPPSAAAPGDCYYPSNGVFVARDGVYCLAVKAGNNGDSHNHNDTGSFTLYKNGRPVLIDVGVETYTQKTFSPQRYELWPMQSAWHNLPTFGGVQQCDGAAYAARDVQVSLGETAACISMELAGAWPAQARLASFRRTVTLQKGAGVLVEDVCRGAYGEASLSLLFCDRPVWDGKALRAGDAVLTFTGGGAPHIEAVPITDARLRLAWPDTLYRVRVPFQEALSCTIV